MNGKMNILDCYKMKNSSIPMRIKLVFNPNEAWGWFSPHLRMYWQDQSSDREAKMTKNDDPNPKLIDPNDYQLVYIQILSYFGVFLIIIWKSQNFSFYRSACAPLPPALKQHLGNPLH